MTVFVYHAVVLGYTQTAAGRRFRLFPVLSCVSTAHVRLDARHQLTHGERLGDIVVCTQLETHDLVGLFLTGGQHDDRRVLFRAHPPADLKAVHLGQHHVQQNQVGRFLKRAAQTFRAVICRECVVALTL